MTYTINDQCINCENCLPQCPTGAITKDKNNKLSIDSELCNDCVGFYGVAQCHAVCPTSYGCSVSLSSLIKSIQQPTNNYWDNWFATYDCLLSRLKAQKETKYWQHWFNNYSQKLELLLNT